MKKIKPHPNGGRHKWKHVEDVELTSMKIRIGGPSTANIKFRAKYECDCGATKIGPRQ